MHGREDLNVAQRNPRHIVTATIIWIVLSIIGLAVAFAIGPNFANWGAVPPVASARTEDINQVMAIFTYLSIPVFMLVAVYGGYAVFAFRSRGRPDSDGPAMRGNMPLQWSWLLLSIVLAGFLYFYGLYFLGVVNAAPKGDVLTVNVNGEQWLWDYTYPQYQNIRGTTLELPVNRPVKFVITSTDVQHSFWIPALGIKQDAVPGETTSISVTPTVIGNYDVRCAELCGLYHAYMNTPVKVVSQADFDAWVLDQQSAQASHGSPSSAFSGFVVRDLIVRRSTIVQEG